jgi:acyl-CoA dehydrogenase
MPAATAFLAWPFFDAAHRELVARIDAFGEAHLASAAHPEERGAVDERCRVLVRALGAAGLTRYAVPPPAAAARFDVRSLALIRERLAWYDGLADFAFAMQGLGSGALSLAGSAELKARYLPLVIAGDSIAAFAISEPDAGSDVAALACQARREGEHYVLNGQKTWISNGGIADFYCLFARTAAAEKRPDGSVAARGISAFVVDANAAGFRVSARIDTLAPHPLGTLSLADVVVPASQRLGEEGAGFKLAMRTLDVFRTSVAGAALGFAQRALDEALAHVRTRAMFGRTLADLQLTQAALADMATEIDAARLQTYRAAWRRDRGEAVTEEVAMAKLAATESAQRAIDRALQLFGGRGVVHGSITERLYREIRALRIYEGATEVQKLIIARELLAATGAP